MHLPSTVTQGPSKLPLQLPRESAGLKESPGLVSGPAILILASSSSLHLCFPICKLLEFLLSGEMGSVEPSALCRHLVHSC